MAKKIEHLNEFLSMFGEMGLPGGLELRQKASKRMQAGQYVKQEDLWKHLKDEDFDEDVHINVRKVLAEEGTLGMCIYECQDMSSSHLGAQKTYPFGPKWTFKNRNMALWSDFDKGQHKYPRRLDMELASTHKLPVYYYEKYREVWVNYCFIEGIPVSVPAYVTREADEDDLVQLMLTGFRNDWFRVLVPANSMFETRQEAIKHLPRDGYEGQWSPQGTQTGRFYSPEACVVEPVTKPQGFRLTPEQRAFFEVEIRNEDQGGIRPATLESAMESLGQAPGDVIADWCGREDWKQAANVMESAKFGGSVRKLYNVLGNLPLQTLIEEDLGDVPAAVDGEDA